MKIVHRLATFVLFVFVAQEKDVRVTEVSLAESIIDCINNCNNITYSKKINFTKGEISNNIESDGYDKKLIYMNQKFGKIISLTSPTRLPGMMSYQIVAEKGRWTMIVKVESDNSISFLHFTDPKPSITLTQRNATPMRLPFSGDGYVVEGGATSERNYHILSGNRGSRYAIDFSMENKDGSLIREGGSTLENYVAFGKEIVAAADGEIVVVIDGTPDNKPYDVNTITYCGNAVIIKHADFEFSGYYHLKRKSICVEVGQKVVSGQVIGQCGNSGYSIAPHLHFETTNSENANLATGFMPYFQKVALKRNGIQSNENEYTPVKGDHIKSLD